MFVGPPSQGSGGIANSASGSARIRNTVIADNVAGTAGGTPDFAGAIDSLGDNLIGDTAGSGGWLASDIQNVDPLLGPLADNGGPTQTHSLLPGSPAIDAGNNAGAPQADQRGEPFTRIANGTVDIGAYETQPLRFVVDILADENDENYDAGDLSLRKAIQLTSNNPGHDIIEFSPALAGAMITLTMGELSINSDLTLNGLGADQLAVSGNKASRVFGIAAAATVDLTGLTIRDGSSSGQGGGILNAGTLRITASTVMGNTSGGGSSFGTGRGGGVYNSGVLVINNSTISGNTAVGGFSGESSGGGVYGDSGTVTINNSTVSGNSAIHAGAIHNNAAITIKSSTITDSFALTRFGSLWRSGEPGGVRNSATGTLTIQNTIIAGNRIFTDIPSSTNVAGAFNSLGNNLIGDTFRSTGWIESDLVGSPNNPINPQLGPLTNNGGPTMTHALLGNSPAIDAGSNVGAPGVDQRGSIRPLDGNGDGDAVVDIGAFEGVTGPSQTFQGTEADDTYSVQLDATGTIVQVSGPGTTFTALLASAPLLSFDTLGGNDQVIVEFVNGNPLPTNGLEFLGGLAEDQLIVRNATTAIGMYASATSQGQGTLALGGRPITLIGVEQNDVSRLHSFSFVTPDRSDVSVVSRADGTAELTNAFNDVAFSVANVVTLIVDAATNDTNQGEDLLRIAADGIVPIGFIQYHGGVGANRLILERGTARVDATESDGGTLETTVVEDAEFITNGLRQTSLTIQANARAVILPNDNDATASVLNSLTVDVGGTLDIHDNALQGDCTLSHAPNRTCAR